MRGHPLIRGHFLRLMSYLRHRNLWWRDTCHVGTLSLGLILRCPLKTGFTIITLCENWCTSLVICMSQKLIKHDNHASSTLCLGMYWDLEKYSIVYWFSWQNINEMPRLRAFPAVKIDSNIVSTWVCVVYFYPFYGSTWILLSIHYELHVNWICIQTETDWNPCFLDMHWCPVEGISIKPLYIPNLYQTSIKPLSSLYQTSRRSPAVACWASDHWVASSNPIRG